MTAQIPEPLRWDSLGAVERASVLRRPALNGTRKLRAETTEIVDAVRCGGDRALREMTMRFDGVELQDIEVPRSELDAALAALPSSLRAALTVAIRNIESFHHAQRPPALSVETSPGVVCERIVHPLDAVGLYVPAGTAPLPSTVLMLAIPARLAACPLRILCVPPGADGRIDTTVLAAAKLCGVQRVFAVGGAQAIAAMAYGTETVPEVVKIFGPGNRWVTAAKTLVAADPDGAAIDMPAGPSELVVIADGAADPAVVAADLLSQAEHGPDSQVFLLTDCEKQARAVAREIPAQAGRLERWEIVSQSLQHAALIITGNIGEAIDIANGYAPEHLIVNTINARGWLPRIRNAGSVFLGPNAPESVGDYCSGTNHVLPTYGWSRACSGLGLSDFSRSMTVQELSDDGIAAIGPHAQRLALAEGLQAHAEAIAIRLRRRRRGAVA